MPRRRNEALVTEARSRVEGLTLNLLTGTVRAGPEGIRAFSRPYVDRSSLPQARLDAPGSVVFRWTNDIIAVEIEVHPDGEWSERTLPPAAFSPSRHLVEAAIGRVIEGWGVTRDRGRGTVFVDRRPERDFVAVAGGALSKQLPFLHVFARWEISGRVLRRRGSEPLVGVQIGMRTRTEVDATVAELFDRGLRLIGRPVLALEARYADEEPRLRLVGTIRAIQGDEAIVRGREGESRRPLVSLFVAGRREVLNDIADLGGPQGRLQWDSVQNRIADWQSPGRRLDRLRTVADGLSGKSVDLGGGGQFIVSGLAQIESGNDQGRYVRIEEPTFVFDVGRHRTHLNARKGLDQHGPFDKEQFGSRPRHAIVVTPAAFKGSVELFIKAFADGVPGARAYASGFARKYRTLDLGVTFHEFELTRPESQGYRDACLAALAKGPKPDIAFVVIEERHRYASGEDPYLIAKSIFLSQGVPVQELELETIQGPSVSIPFVLDNVALAVYAKMGGTPFVMAAQTPIARELVFGIGSAMVGTDDGGTGDRVVGITSVFSADGNYLLSHCSSEVPFRDYPSEISRTLKRTITEVAQRNGWKPGDPVRLVFHGFHRMRDDDARAIKEVVSALGDYEVEFAFVHINEDHEWFLFDTRSGRRGADSLVPDRGYVVPLSDYEAILTVVGPSELRNRPELTPRPLVLELHRESTFTDLGYLSAQAFRFTALSWRSFAPASRPITILYADRIASLLGRLRSIPNWNPDVLSSAEMRLSRWFL
jgi:hypothetical protein